VALLIGTDGSFGRGLLQGIAKFNREHRSWSTYFHPQGAITTPPTWLRRWKGDGALVLIHHKEMTQYLRRLKIPVVNLRLVDHPTPFPYVGLNHTKIGEAAAAHLLSLGLQQFAFCGRPRGLNVGLDRRADAFQQHIQQAGKPCALYSPKKGLDWALEQDRLAEWVASLPKPVGIMASNDERGSHLLDACRRCGAVVPDDVAVIGVDNDETLCELSIPPLTSVDVNAQQVGYEAARLLDEMMAGRCTPPAMEQLDPRGIVTRRSTDIIASEDAEVNTAVAFIRANAGQPIRVPDVLRYVALSRATLQRRMKRQINRTIYEEIQRVRIARAQELLLNSDLNIKQVSLSSGFHSVQYMTRVFHAAMGETPAQFRNRRFKTER
jgi:LacI family transcriptional regulator